MTKARLWGVVPAAGIGQRMGAACPKQYLPLAGATVIEHSVQALLDHPRIERVVVALQANDERAARLPLLSNPRVLRAQGGAERCDSVLSALSALQKFAYDEDWVLVHDAARPCVSAADIVALVARTLESGQGAVLAQPVLDTLKQVDVEGRVTTTVDRQQFWRAQTPQMFRFAELRSALQRALAQGQVITDEASAMEWAGYPVQVVEGSASNIKITRPGDLELAAYYLQQIAQ